MSMHSRLQQQCMKCFIATKSHMKLCMTTAAKQCSPAHPAQLVEHCTILL
jgi:hypothetical protein